METIVELVAIDEVYFCEEENLQLCFVQGLEFYAYSGSFQKDDLVFHIPSTVALPQSLLEKIRFAKVSHINTHGVLVSPEALNISELEAGQNYASVLM